MRFSRYHENPPVSGGLSWAVDPPSCRAPHGVGTTTDRNCNEPPSPAKLTQALSLRRRLQALGSYRGVCSCQLAMRREVLQAASPRRRTGEINKSAEIWNRSRSLRTMDMLSSRLPVNTSLTRLGVPRSGTRSARDRPCCSIR